MSQFNTEALVITLALVGIVIMIAALLSGVIERSGFPQVAVFLLIGAALGPAGLGILDLTLTSPILHIVATLSLVLVLFTDAISLNLAEVRRASTLAQPSPSRATGSWRPGRRSGRRGSALTRPMTRSG